MTPRRSVFIGPACSWMICIFLHALPSSVFCLDTEEATLFAQMKKAFAHGTDDYQRSFERLGNKALAIDLMISTEGDYSLARKLLADVPKLRTWALKNINQAPGGGNYRLQILDLATPKPDKSIVLGRFNMRLPMMQRELERHFQTTTSYTAEVFTLTASSIPEDDSLIDSATLKLRVFPAPKSNYRLWVSLRAHVKFKSWLVYEALPDKLIQRELGERALIVVDNYLSEENRLRSNQNPIGKKATPEAQPASLPK